MMEIADTSIPGCFEITPAIFRDERGAFVKTFHEKIFRENRLASNFAEEYYSTSHHGVLRGLHFQTPPFDHIKMVYCVSGEIFDTVVDLRVGSSTYGRYDTFIISAKKGNILYIPAGLAHGFYVISSSATVVYKVTTVYSQECDKGILWNSVGIPWPDNHPVLSRRDKEFPLFKNFDSPFTYKRLMRRADIKL